MNTHFTAQESQLQQLVKTSLLSPSHQLDHLERVAAYGDWLASQYQARRGVVVAAALVHDLGRTDTSVRGVKTAEVGAVLAQSLLEKSGYSSEEITLITRCVAEHDHPNFHSDLLESRILKEADYLDGFGARGILRSLIYASETGGGITEAVERLRRKSLERLRHLEFKETQRLGWQLHRLTEVFLSELEREPELSQVSYRGSFIILEGISGSGKDTQGALLVEYLNQQGLAAQFINHPTPLLKQLWQDWKQQVQHEMSDVFLMLADRVRMVREVIKPTLEAGKIVVSSRSSISAQAYQPSAEFSPAFYRFCFSFEPVADLVLYLDLDPETALSRADHRVQAGQERDRGLFGTRQQAQRQQYEKVLSSYPNVTKIDASQSVDQVHQAVLTALKESGLVV